MAPADMPYIMPDGSTLSHVLCERERKPGKGSKQKGSRKRNGHKLSRAERLDNIMQARSEEEARDLAQASALGTRTRLRWLNERLLRNLAGPMTAQDMTALFNPVPFGEERQSPLQRVLSESPHLWERLRNVDMDSEAALLQRWQADSNHRRSAAHSSRTADPNAAPAQQSHSADARPQAQAAEAIAAWHRVGRKGRGVLKKMSVHRVHELEELVTDFMTSDSQQDVLPSEDAFERCALHGLCAFHAAPSHSVNTKRGRQVQIRQAGRLPASGQAPVSQRASRQKQGSTRSMAPDLQHSNQEQAAAADAVSLAYTDDAQSQPGALKSTLQLDWQAFTAVDVLLALEDSAQSGTSLSKQALAEHRAEHYPAEWHSMQQLAAQQ